LPGLDGTADLFEDFAAVAPAGLPVQCQRLPNDKPRAYPELAEWVHAHLPSGRVVLIAESFSGPLALLIADRCPRVVALVLCASFVESPLPRFVARVPKVVWSRPPPIAVFSVFLTGGDRGLAQRVHRAIAAAGDEVIAERITAALEIDVSAAPPGLGRLSCTIVHRHCSNSRITDSFRWGKR
jgi:pimeloyl-[acyl-carrier protein] methyl ester esterase